MYKPLALSYIHFFAIKTESRGIGDIPKSRAQPLTGTSATHADLSTLLASETNVDGAATSVGGFR